MNLFQENIRLVYEHSERTQTDCAKIFDVHHTTFCYWLNTNAPIASDKRMVKHFDTFEKLFLVNPVYQSLETLEPLRIAMLVNNKLKALDRNLAPVMFGGVYNHMEGE